MTRFLRLNRARVLEIGWFWRAIVVFGLAVVGALAARSPSEPIFPVDDAYITIHNAVSLLNGRDPNFDSPPLHGATSPLHTGLVALFASALTPDWASYVAGWFAIVLYALGVLELARSLRLDIVRGVLLVAVALVVGRLPHQLTNGLETGLALAGVAWTLALEKREDAAQRPWVPGLLGLLPFLRPELLAFSGLVLSWRCARHLRGPREQRGRSLARDLGAFGLTALPLWAWLVANTGAWMPPTIEAKKMFFAEGCRRATAREQTTLTNVAAFARDLGWAAWLAPLCLGSLLGVLCWGTFAAFVLAYYSSFPGALGHYEGRYLYVFVPMLVFGLATVMGARARLAQVAGALIALALLYDADAHYEERNWIRYGGRTFTAAELEGAAAWVRANVAPADVALVHDAGYISAKTSAKLVDMVGLKTPHSARVHEDITWPRCGRERWRAIVEIAKHERPTYLVALEGWDRLYGFTRALQLFGWKLERVKPDGAYAIYRLTPPPTRLLR